MDCAHCCARVCFLKAVLLTQSRQNLFEKDQCFDKKLVSSLLSDDFSQLDEFNSPPSNFIPQIHFYPHSLSGSICATFYMHNRFRCKPHHQNCNTDLVQTKVIFYIDFGTKLYNCFAKIMFADGGGRVWVRGYCLPAISSPSTPSSCQLAPWPPPSHPEPPTPPPPT